MAGPVEADETYVGGKARNMSAKRRAEVKPRPGRDTASKTAVVGVKDRTTNRVSARPVADVSASSLTGMITETVDLGARVFPTNGAHIGRWHLWATAMSGSSTAHASTCAATLPLIAHTCYRRHRGQCRTESRAATGWRAQCGPIIGEGVSRVRCRARNRRGC